jgi:hypothetical protein
MSKKKKAAAQGNGGSPSEKEQVQGDLRAVERLVRAAIEGSSDAHESLIMYGRDAAGLVAEIAEQKKNDEMKELARRLVATPPQVKTNLLELRLESIKELVREAQKSAPNATDVGELVLVGPQVVVFDPTRIAEAIAKRGRPRLDAERVGAGDLVFFGIDAFRDIVVRISTASPPAGQAVVKNRLRVDSGIVFIGPPQGADGPRLGELRLHPFRTNLHAALASGRFARVKPGVYVASAFEPEAGGVRVHLVPDPNPKSPDVSADLAALGTIPSIVAKRDAPS